MQNEPDHNFPESKMSKSASFCPNSAKNYYYLLLLIQKQNLKRPEPLNGQKNSLNYLVKLPDIKPSLSTH